MKESAKEEVQWDKKKIILFLVAAILLIGIGFEAKDLILGKSISPSVSIAKPDIKGAAVQVVPDIKNNVQSQLDNLKTEAQGVNLVEIASSSPQVQKVINDLKALQDYPKNQVKATCQQICNSF
jgi:ABC-type proline/glycine betaine transport system substrate-binding protein